MAFTKSGLRTGDRGITLRREIIVLSGFQGGGRVFFLLFLILFNFSVPCFSFEPEMYLATVNDNYTGSVKSGKKGLYIGPDDFLTFSLMMGIRWKQSRFDLSEHVITSRKFGYRYDLIRLGYFRKFQDLSFNLEPGMEVWARGRFGGKEIQNSFHDFQNLPLVGLDYIDSKAMVTLVLNGSHALHLPQFLKQYARIGFETRLSPGVVPTRLGGYLSDVIMWRRLSLEMLLGARFYPNQVEYYSELIRSGPYGGVRMAINLPFDLEFGLGMIGFAAKNLINDPLYKNKPHRYSPQIYTTFTYPVPKDKRGRNLRLLSEYF